MEIHMFFFSFLVFLVSQSAATNFTCPTANITSGSGVFPPDSNNSTRFPANYTCLLNFRIPTGYVVKFTVYSNVTNRTLDEIIVFQAKSSSIHSFYNGLDYFYAPADFATLIIVTRTNTSQFSVKYEYMNIQNLNRTNLPIAQPIPLQLDASNQYTFSSPNQQKIIIHTGSYVFEQDPLLENILVYDGPDTNSPYMGNLFDMTTLYDESRRVSSGSTLTIINLYGSTTFFSYGLVNEYQYVSAPNATYLFRVFSQNTPIDTRYAQYAGTTNFVTYYCPDCGNEAYISLLESRFPQIPQKGVSFQPLTPTDNKDVLLSYGPNDNLPLKLPQLIPGNLFTMKSSTEMLSLKLESNSGMRANWTTPYPGRSGTVFSPSLWSSGATPSYNWKFESSTLLRFTFNVQSAQIIGAGEKLTVEIGSPDSAPFTTGFTSSVSNQGVQVANGTYLLVTYMGNDSRSSSVITFKMDDLSVSPPSTTPKDGMGTVTFGVETILLIVSALIFQLL